MAYHMAAQDEITAEVDRFQEQVGEGFVVSPNSYGVRIECTTCHASATHDTAYRFARVHPHGGLDREEER